MTIVIEDVEIERLAERIAQAEGVPVTEVVRESLLSLADRRGVDAGQPPCASALPRWHVKWMRCRGAYRPTHAAKKRSWATTSTVHGD